MIKTTKTKDGQPAYEADIYGRNGRRIRKRFFRKADAQAFVLEQKIAKSSGGRFNPKADKCTFSEVADDWFQLRILGQQKSKGTEVNYSGLLKNYLNPQLGKLKLKDICRRDGDLLVSELLGKGLNAKTVDGALTLAKQILKFAVENDLLVKSPFLGVKAPKGSAREDRYLSTSEIEKLYRESEALWFHDVIVLALNSGMRIGEILGLQWDCVDLEKGRLTVRRTLTKCGLQDRTKTNSIRYISMNDTLVKLFNKKQSDRVKVGSFDTYVFAKRGGRHGSPDHFTTREFKKLLESCGIANFRFHDLRHTFASQYMMNGGNVFDLQKILGHTKVEMTMRYAHLSDSHSQKAARVIEFPSRLHNDGQFLDSESSKKAFIY